MRAFKIVILTIALGVPAVSLSVAQENNTPRNMQEAIGRTPPRLSYVDGQVSFWRPGAEDWVEAQVNTALAPGDQLFVGPDGNLELQIGARAFIRGGGDAQISLERREPDFLQFKVIAGSVAFDMRQVEPGRMVTVDTPHAAFNIEAEGYYRIDASDEQTNFITRRTGRATAAIDGGGKVPIRSNESMTIAGVRGPKVTSQEAPPLDEWDNWNYARTDQFLEAESSGYVPSEVYGVNDLERHGTWLVTSTYGPVWRPRGVAVGWVPYSTGAWMRDPYYGWTWVDTAPWGWAPYHYGRWVHVNSYWCWAPGPRVLRPAYAPALVAFFGEPGVKVSVGIGGPVVGWVSLGWGEPLVPWWGRPGFIHRPWWGGWGGPRCVNNKVINHNAIVTVSHIHSYRNMRRRNAVVMVDKHRFGRGPISGAHIIHGNANALRPLHGAPHVTALPANFVPTAPHGRRPPEHHPKRPAVTISDHHTPRKVDAGRSSNIKAWQNRKMHRPSESMPSRSNPVLMKPRTPSNHGPILRDKPARSRAPEVKGNKKKWKSAPNKNKPAEMRSASYRKQNSSQIHRSGIESSSSLPRSGPALKMEGPRHFGRPHTRPSQENKFNDTRQKRLFQGPSPARMRRSQAPSGHVGARLKDSQPGQKEAGQRSTPGNSDRGSSKRMKRHGNRATEQRQGVPSHNGPRRGGR